MQVKLDRHNVMFINQWEDLKIIKFFTRLAYNRVSGKKCITGKKNKKKCIKDVEFTTCPASIVIFAIGRVEFHAMIENKS